MQESTGGFGAEAPAKFVEMDAVALRYGGPEGTLALDGTTLSVARGEFAAVVGPSGCGKSSLMKLVTGLLPCTAGSIRVAGTDVDGPLKIVGMAFQNPTLLPWRNTLLNTMLPLEIVRPHRQPRSYSRRSGSPGSRTCSRGCCRAACSSAQACAGRSSTSRSC
jgi:NitT/TauT family transport system ATP-binding protein